MISNEDFLEAKFERIVLETMAGTTKLIEKLKLGSALMIGLQADRLPICKSVFSNRSSRLISSFLL